MILQELLKLQESELDDIDQTPFFMDAFETAMKPNDSILHSVNLLQDEIEFTVLYKTKADSLGILEKIKKLLKGVVSDAYAMNANSKGTHYAVKFELELEGISPEELEELESQVKKKYPQAKVS